MGLNFLVTYLITLLYGDTALGSYTFAFTLCQATAIIFALGMPNALISHLGLKPANHPFSQFMLRRGLLILGFVSLLPLTVFHFGANYIAQHILNNATLGTYITIAALTVPVMVLHEFVLYFFIATGNFIKFNIFMFIVPNVTFILLLVLLQNNPDYYTLAYYLIAVALALTVELFIALRQYNAAANDEKLSIKNIVTFAFPMMFSSIMLYLLNMTDIFMLTAMESEEQVGYYSIAYKIASLSMLIIISMNVVLAPKIAQYYKAGDLGELHKTVKKTTHLIILLTLPLVALLMLFSGFILGVYGEGFLSARAVLLIIAFSFLLNATTGNVDQILNMTGNQKTLQYLTFAGFAVNVGFNVLLIPNYGIEGAAMASLVTNVVFNGACVFYIKKRLGFYTFI